MNSYVVMMKVIKNKIKIFAEEMKNITSSKGGQGTNQPKYSDQNNKGKDNCLTYVNNLPVYSLTVLIIHCFLLN